MPFASAPSHSVRFAAGSTLHGYLEVPTPAIVPSPGMEPTLRHRRRRWLPATSPEFALKRVMAAGLPRVYEVAPCFREREHCRGTPTSS